MLPAETRAVSFEPLRLGCGDVEDVGPDLCQHVRVAAADLSLSEAVASVRRQANRPGLLPDPDSVGCDYEQLAAVVLRFRVYGDVSQQPAENHRYDLGMVVDFQRDDSPVARRRIRNDVREVPIQREQYCVEFLRPGDDNRVRRFGVDVVAKAQDLMTLGVQVVNDGV